MRLHQSQRRHDIFIPHFFLLCPLIFFQRQQRQLQVGTWQRTNPLVHFPACYKDDEHFRVFPVGGFRHDAMTHQVSAATQEPACS